MNQQGKDSYHYKWYTVVAVSTITFLTAFTATAINVALPTLIRELNTSFAVAQWVILVYFLTSAALAISIGRLGDIVDKRTAYLMGLTIFIGGSVLCSLSLGISWLIIARIFQAIGGTTVTGLSFAIVTEAFPSSERGKALSMLGVSVSIGLLSGRVLGGFLLDILSWRWIFLVNLPIGIIVFLILWYFMRPIAPLGGQRFDYWGAFTLLTSLLCLILALTLGQQSGFNKNIVLFLGISCAIFLALFIFVEKTTCQPMLDLRIFQDNTLSKSLLTGFFVFLSMVGVSSLLPFYLELILGYPRSQVGIILAFTPLLLIIMHPVAGILSDRFGTQAITLIGLVFLLIGYYLLMLLSSATTALNFILRFLVVGFGLGLFQSPNNSAIMGAVSQGRLGVASGILSLKRALGDVIGISVLGALWSIRVTHYIGSSVSGDATKAPIAAQLAGLQDAFRFPVILMIIALLLRLLPNKSKPGRAEAQQLISK